MALLRPSSRRQRPQTKIATTSCTRAARHYALAGVNSVGVPERLQTARHWPPAPRRASPPISSATNHDREVPLSTTRRLTRQDSHDGLTPCSCSVPPYPFCVLVGREGHPSLGVEPPPENKTHLKHLSLTTAQCQRPRNLILALSISRL